MRNENPVVNYRMTFNSSVCIIQAMSAIVTAMTQIESGQSADAFRTLQEVLRHEGYDEFSHAVISLDETQH